MKWLNQVNSPNHLGHFLYMVRAKICALRRTELPWFRCIFLSKFHVETESLDKSNGACGWKAGVWVMVTLSPGWIGALRKGLSGQFCLLLRHVMAWYSSSQGESGSNWLASRSSLTQPLHLREVNLFLLTSSDLWYLSQSANSLATHFNHGHHAVQIAMTYSP